MTSRSSTSSKSSTFKSDSKTKTSSSSVKSSSQNSSNKRSSGAEKPKKKIEDEQKYKSNKDVTSQRANIKPSRKDTNISSKSSVPSNKSESKSSKDRSNKVREESKSRSKTKQDSSKSSRQKEVHQKSKDTQPKSSDKKSKIDNKQKDAIDKERKKSRESLSKTKSDRSVKKLDEKNEKQTKTKESKSKSKSSDKEGLKKHESKSHNKDITANKGKRKDIKEKDKKENEKENEPKEEKKEEKAHKEEENSFKEDKQVDEEKKIAENVPDVQITSSNLSPNSLETLESGISMTSGNDLSDGEVEESISSRFVEVDETDLNGDPSPPSSSVQQNEDFYPTSVDFPVASVESVEEAEEYLYYEDDFENYESDFEDDEDDDDETAEEDMDEDEDSEEEDEESDEDEGIGETPDPEMESILKALQIENNRPRVTATPSRVKYEEDLDPPEDNGSVPDERVQKKPSRPKTSRGYVNFAKARERAKAEKALEKNKSRGQILQEMIQFDTVSIDLFTQVPESYEAYIAAFGHSNSVQVSIQTSEDALTESIQTDSTTMLDKWTQNPIHICVKGENLPTPQDYLGVGGDSAVDETDGYNSYRAVASDTGRLTKFLSAASQVILMLLEEDAILREESSLISDGDDNFGFSKSGISLGSGLTSLLEGRESTVVAFCPSDSLLVLTGHGFYDPNNNSIIEPQETEEGKEELSPVDGLSDPSSTANGALLCLWSVHQPSFPQRILTCRSPPCVASFSPGRPIIVISGLNDGSLAAWDLRESPASHPLLVEMEKEKWRLSPPSYITACSKDDVQEGSPIVAIETISRPDDETPLTSGSFQVVSLSSSGQLTWWVLVQGELRPTKVVDSNNPGISSELGAAPWSRITISRATSISMEPFLSSEDFLGGSNLCFDLKLSGNEANQMYVAAANGNVIHCSRHRNKLHPASFSPEIEPGAEAVSISVCPHDYHYFLVGGSDGLIRLHTVNSSSPLTCWQASTNPVPVKKLEWSPTRPCVFYMLDIMGRFHIWDLSAGDIYPVVSVDEGGLIGGKLVNFNIASNPRDGNHATYAVFASDSGSVGVRSISSQFVRPSEEKYLSELERFKCYVNII